MSSDLGDQQDPLESLIAQILDAETPLIENLPSWVLRRGSSRSGELQGFDPTGKVYFDEHPDAINGDALGGDLTIWDVESGKVKRQGRPSGISDDRRFLAYNRFERDGNRAGLSVLDIVENREFGVFENQESAGYYGSVFFSPGNEFIIGVNAEGAVHIASLADPSSVASLPRPYHSRVEPVFDASGKRMLIQFGGRNPRGLVQTSWGVVSLEQREIVAEMPYGVVTDDVYRRVDDMARPPAFSSDLKMIGFVRGKTNTEEREHSRVYLSRTWTATLWRPDSNETIKLGDWVAPPDENTDPPKLQFACDGRRLVVERISRDSSQPMNRDRKIVEVWDIEKQERVLDTATIVGNVKRVSLIKSANTLAVSFSSPGRRSSDDYGFALFSVESGERLVTEPARGHLAVDPTGRWLVLSARSGTDDTGYGIVNTANGKLHFDIKGSYGYPNFSSDGNALILRPRKDESSLLLVNTSDGTSTRIPAPAGSLAGKLRISHNREEGDVLRLWNLDDGQPAGIVAARWGPYVEGGELRILSSSVSNDGQRVALNVNGQLRIARTSDGKVYAASRRMGHLGYLLDLDVTEDGTLLATAGDDGTVGFWDAMNGEYRGQIDGFSIAVNSIMFNQDASQLLVLDAGGLLSAWKLDSRMTDIGELVDAKLDWSVNVQKRSRFAGDQRFPSVLVYGETNSMQLVATADGQTIATISAPEALIDAVQLSDSKFLAVTQSLKLQRGSFDQQTPWEVLGEGIRSIAVSSDGNMVVTGGVNVQLWNARDTLQPVMSLDKDGNGALFVDIAKNGKVVVVSAAGDQINISDSIAMQQELERLFLLEDLNEQAGRKGAQELATTQ